MLWIVITIIIFLIICCAFWCVQSEHFGPRGGPRYRRPPRVYNNYITPITAGYWNRMADYALRTSYIPEPTTLVYTYKIDPMIVTRVKNSTPSGSSVFLYKYRGQNVLLVETAECADCEAYVYNIPGQFLGKPFGGISGRGDGKFPDWFPSAQLIGQLN